MKKYIQHYIKNIKTFFYTLVGVNKKNKTMSEEMRRHIDHTRQFFRKLELVSEVSELVGEELNAKKCLMVYSINDQRTYVIKSDGFYYIVNDDKGNIVVALKRRLTDFNYSVNDTRTFYEVRFDNTKSAMKVSKNLFIDTDELKTKLNIL
jgi:hypothetical protein